MIRPVFYSYKMTYDKRCESICLYFTRYLKISGGGILVLLLYRGSNSDFGAHVFVTDFHQVGIV